MNERSKPRWQDVVFDITAHNDRQRHFHADGTSLPITFEVSPLEHAEMCKTLRDGLLDACWSAFERVPLEVSKNGCEAVDFATLDESRRMMELAAAHAEKSREPTGKPMPKPSRKGAR